MSLFILLPTLLLSCSDDNNPGISNDSDDMIFGSIEGEWLDFSSGSELVVYCTTKYLRDGTIQLWWGMAMNGASIYTTTDGNYHFENGNLSESYVDPLQGNNVTDEYKVRYLDNYTLVQELESDVTTLCRVVDTYNLEVGDRQLFEAGEGFNAISYSSTASGIADINPDNGEIIAKRRGLAFVKAESTLGTVAIRVNVIDPQNYIDDFSKLLQAPLKEANRWFGDSYIEMPMSDSPLTLRAYNYVDPLIESIRIQYSMQKIQIIDITLRDYNLDALIEDFDNKYLVLEQNSVVRRYLGFSGDGIFNMFFFIQDGNIIYMPYVEPTPEPEPEPELNDEDFQLFERLLRMGAVEAASLLNHEITEQEWEEESFDFELDNNEIFSNGFVSFDGEEPYEVGSVIVYLKKGVSQENVEPWYKEHYVETDDELNPYTNEDGDVFIRFKKSGSRTYVQYKTTKFRR